MASMNTGTAISLAVAAALCSAEVAEARAPHHAGVTVHADNVHLDLGSHLHDDGSATAAPEVMPFNNSAAFDPPPLRRPWQQPESDELGTPLVLRAQA
jgi:hypothetical protein